jgi:hypothetical protein
VSTSRPRPAELLEIAKVVMQALGVMPDVIDRCQNHVRGACSW